MEQTFIFIKPDGVQRGLVGEVIGRFEKKGMVLKGLKLVKVDRGLAERHYEYLNDDPPFRDTLINYVIDQPVVAMVWASKDAVAIGKKIIGPIHPSCDEAIPGSVRGDYAIETYRNVIHGSDTVEKAWREIGVWFPEGLAEWESSLHTWVAA